MDTAQRTTLQKCRVKLVNDLMIEEMFDQIEAHGLFTQTMLENIKAKPSRPDQVRTFLDSLQKRGPYVFDKFLLCLRESQHEFLASYVEAEYKSQTGNGNPRITQMTSNTFNTTQSLGFPINTFHAQETQESQLQHPSSGSVLLCENQVSRPVQETQWGLLNEVMAEEVTSKQFQHEDNCMDISPCVNDVGDVQGNCYSMYLPEAPLHVAPVPIVPRTGYTGNVNEEYRMESIPRGLLLIINNKNFQQDSRDGTEFDCINLNNLFKQLGFYTDVKENLTAQAIKDTLQQLANLELLNFVDCLAVAIFSHGSGENLLGVDDVAVSVNEVFAPFFTQNCPALRSKPKFFILNACRGDIEDNGGPPASGFCNATTVKTDVTLVQPKTCNMDRMPNMTDFLIAYSTVPGYVNWRDRFNGTWFIQEFVKVFFKHAHDTDVVRMLVKVNQQVSSINEHSSVQIPAPQLMLTKTWYLNPVCNTAI